MAWKCDPKSIEACLHCEYPDCIAWGKPVPPPGGNAKVPEGTLCANCGRRVATGGYKLCEKCRAYRRKYDKAYYAKKKALKAAATALSAQEKKSIEKV